LPLVAVRRDQRRGRLTKGTSMASISTDSKTGFRTVQLVGQDGKRRSIRLGAASLKTAEEVKRRVEYLASAKAADIAIDLDTSKWLAKIDDELHARLVKADLTQPRKQAEPAPTCPALATFLAGYVDGRTDHKPNTTKTINQARALLVEYFGADRLLNNITAANAKDWQVALRAKDYAPATIATHVKKAKQMFGYAVEAEHIAKNPFAKLKAPKQVDSSRQEFVSHETIKRVIDAATDAEWRLIIALARFGGLRCPSEVLELQWQWVDWEHNRFKVFAPKQEHLETGGWRVVPLFQELRPYLAEAFEQAEPGATHVVTRYRDAGTNLRTQFMRIINRACVKPWGRLFHNLRSSRQTELTETFPAHVVAAWLGNTEKIASQHYLQVTEAHMQRGAISGAPVVQNMVQNPSARFGKVSQDLETEQSESLVATGICAGSDVSEMTYGEEKIYPQEESNKVEKTRATS
jgi:integrase